MQNDTFRNSSPCKQSKNIQNTTVIHLEQVPHCLFSLLCVPLQIDLQIFLLTFFTEVWKFQCLKPLCVGVTIVIIACYDMYHG